MRILIFKNLKTNRFYNELALENFIKNAQKENFKNYVELGNILTLEFRMSSDKVVWN
jgi:hypothetical protein